ncbi:MAG: RsmD family RNA methyltransferase, partial [Bacteroidia bacterium]|nr:RsmD family RNA methyltransferase [Bacteroidia bacterium]
MRIIGGSQKGRVLKVPQGLPVRPTTDFAKEGLFNILNNRISYDEIAMLDLFSGTGHISLEFASRGCQQVTSVDQNFKCCGFLKAISKELKLEVNVLKDDVFNYLKNSHQKFDLVFADPPYDLPNIVEIHQLVFDRKLLNEGGLLIIEHGPRTKMEELPHFKQCR